MHLPFSEEFFSIHRNLLLSEEPPNVELSGTAETTQNNGTVRDLEGNSILESPCRFNDLLGGAPRELNESLPVANERRDREPHRLINESQSARDAVLPTAHHFLTIETRRSRT